jgi:shikimate 5-dehydrogenase
MEEEFEIPTTAKFVFTAEYKSASPLVQKAKERNLVVVDGLSMLFYQGKRSFTLWTGVEPQVTLQQFVEEIQ